MVAYAVSPIDLIPDFIPVLGQLDDLLLLPIGIALAIRLVPPAVLEEKRARGRGALRWRAMKVTLDGKIALVTGASRGVGKGVAVGLGEAGAEVWVTARTSLEETRPRSPGGCVDGVSRSRAI